jgi:hypothetical protein
MFYAKSAKACVVLGATLVAFMNPVKAAESNSSTAGIDGTGIAGIDGTGAAGIDGTGVNGIDGTGAAGIDGTGAAGIDGTGILGIDGTGILGIDGTGIAGIDGTGAAGIDGTGVAGIDGTGVLLAGPVDSIDRINGVFESMGQVVMASQTMLSGMQVGNYVTVGGTAISSGWYFADTVSVSDLSYVPGSTEVFISGMMSSLDLVNGTAQMGGLTIDYTSSLGGSVAPAGDMWSFHGTRPSLGGSMISTRTAGVK